MAQRAALARNPQLLLLLLDEPLCAFDALLRIELQTALARIVVETLCRTLLVTHDVDEALYFADRIVVLEGSPPKRARAVDRAAAPSLSYANLTIERAQLLWPSSVDGRESIRSELRAVR